MNEHTLDVTSYDKNGSVVTSLTDEKTQEVKAVQITDPENDTTVSITNTGTEVIVVSTTIDEVTGEPIEEKKVFPVLEDITSDLSTGLPERQLRYVYDKWGYTGFAVPNSIFEWTFNLLGGGAISGIAGIFGISRAAAAMVLDFSAAMMYSPGGVLARHLDSDRNGWVALYKRGVRNYKGGPIFAYQHRTY
ncbi:hypothetical protein DYZ47_02915 [Listeria monocytogenes]|uniref:hypothetical protein n=1 Tax=Listeria monocytogenes TaxID=1639 RepID=UPI000EE9A001|nr:hypothetical protein [Listeria monocytogenes]RJZ11783.1 hypothetical protein DYZ47_02915 [Listeria monocytogenes]